MIVRADNTFVVFLSRSRIAQADDLGRRRHEASRHSPDAHGFTGDGLMAHIIGARGECAVHLVTGMKWHQEVGRFGSAPDLGDDVQVRTTSGPKLYVRPSDKSPDWFRIVYVRSPGGSRANIMEVIGWTTYGVARKQPLARIDREQKRPEVHLVPGHLLQPMQLMVASGHPSPVDS